MSSAWDRRASGRRSAAPDARPMPGRCGRRRRRSAAWTGRRRARRRPVRRRSAGSRLRSWAASRFEIVWHESAVVVSDAPLVLSHADAGRRARDPPRADDGVVAVEHRQRLVGLPDIAFAAVVSGRGVEQARADDGDVVAFAAEYRLLYISAAEV